jgi:hypothetical protein
MYRLAMMAVLAVAGVAAAADPVPDPQFVPQRSRVPAPDRVSGDERSFRGATSGQQSDRFVRPAAPASRPASRPALTAKDTEGEVLGIKLVDRHYDPKTGQVVFEVALGNKSNKVMRSVRGYARFDGDAVPRLKGAEHATPNMPMSSAGPIGVGEAVIVRIPVGRLPSETDKEIEESRRRVAEVESAVYSRTRVTFDDGTVRELR